VLERLFLQRAQLIGAGQLEARSYGLAPAVDLGRSDVGGWTADPLPAARCSRTTVTSRVSARPRRGWRRGGNDDLTGPRGLDD
jgi:hypothetical protein